MTLSEIITQNLNSYHSRCHLNDSNGPVRPIVCVLCDRFIIKNTEKYLSLSTLNNIQELFYPEEIFQLSDALKSCYRVDFPENVHLEGNIRNTLQITNCLLSPRSTYVVSSNGLHEGFNICDECNSAILKSKRPKYCIASNYCFGTAPPCLTELTEVELAIITPVKKYGYCFCYTGGQKHVLKGSLAYYKVDKDKIITNFATLAAANINIVVLIYGGITQKQYDRARQKSKIRVDMIYQALIWLLRYNTEWQSFSAGDLLDFVNNLTNPRIITVCDLQNDDDIEAESDESYTVYYPDGNTTTNNGGQPTIEDLQELAYAATQEGNDIGYQLDLQKYACHEYKENNLVNACPLQFSHGRGGLQEIRLKLNGETTTSVDIQEYVEYLSMISIPSFHDGLFCLILYNLHMKQYMFRTASWYLRHKVNAEILATKIDKDVVDNAINRSKYARGIEVDYNEIDSTASQMIKCIDAVAKAPAHSNEAAKKAKQKAKAIQHKFGCPTIFLTITPDDDNCYSVQVLSNNNIDDRQRPVNTESDETLIERAKQRTILRLKYPGICAIYFEMALNAVIKEVLGWNMEEKKQESLGLFGKIDAFTCSIEEQGRGTLHAHMLIWISRLNKKREDLHDDNPEISERAHKYITKYVDKICSNKCYFNDNHYLRNNHNQRGKQKRFTHQCNKRKYKLPVFPNNENLLRLRCQNANDDQLIYCNSCEKTWSYGQLQDSYLCEFLNTPNLSSYHNENRVKRFKALAVEYQASSQQHNIEHYAIDFGYNSHNHCASCFKYCKNAKKKIFDITATGCRYRYPQIGRKKTTIQNVSQRKLPWYFWNGSYKDRYIKEVCLKREEHDAFQNNYCPAISYSKFACNTNISFLTTGPIGEYCFSYVLKGTQYDDIEPYEKLKGAIGNIFSVVKHQYNDTLEAQRRVLAASFVHQSTDTIRAAMAAFLIRNKSRFLYSHDTVTCPIRDLRSLIQGEGVNVKLLFTNQKKPKFQCFAMHYLCRPDKFKNMNVYEFYSNYEVINYTKKAPKDAIRFQTKPTDPFCHPSYNHKTQLCDQCIVKREKQVLLEIFQFDFVDSASFECNILLPTSPISDIMEQYCQLVLLLFVPFKNANDLKIDGKYTNRLRKAVEDGVIKPEYSNFLQNIQDSKGNSFRHKITNDDLDRAADFLHDPNNDGNRDNDLNEDVAQNLAIELIDDNQNDFIDFLLSDINEINETFDIHNDDNITLNLAILKQKGCGNKRPANMPKMIPRHQIEQDFETIQNFIEADGNTNDFNLTTDRTVDVIKVDKDRVALIFNYELNMSLTLNEIIGVDEEIDVMPANGTAASIQDWSLKCNLDTSQKVAFEVITGYYILSYINSIPFLNDDIDDVNHYRIRQEKCRLETLVGRDQIKSDQLICFLHGPGGSGKTTVITLLQIYSKKYHALIGNSEYNRSIVLTAMTGAAATLIGGETTHKALHLNYKSLDANITQEEVELWTNTKLLVIDEISFANNNNIKTINTRLNQFKDTWNGLFGNIHIIFCGDLHQLEPIEGYPLYKNHQKNNSEFKNHINCYIELIGQHRFNSDPEWGGILMRFRQGVPTNEDITAINSRVVPNITTELPNDIKYATFVNKDRDSINTSIFIKRLDYNHRTYYNTDNFIIIFSDDLKIKKNDQYIPFLHHKLFYENCGESDIDTARQGKFDPVLKLYKDCEVMLTENIDVISGLANGTQALVKKIVLIEGCSYTHVKLHNNIQVKAINAAEVNYILLQHKNTNISQPLFKIKPKQFTFKAKIPVPPDLRQGREEPRVSMQARQIPIIINNATTGHKLQGTGVDKLYVYSWNYKKNWPYVVLSRVKKLSGLFLKSEIKKNISGYKMAPDLATLIEYFQTLLPRQQEN